MNLIFELTVTKPSYGKTTYTCAEFDNVIKDLGQGVGRSRLTFETLKDDLVYSIAIKGAPTIMLEVFSEHFYNVHIKDAYINMPFPKQFSKSVKYYGDHAMFILLNL